MATDSETVPGRLGLARHFVTPVAAQASQTVQVRGRPPPVGRQCGSGTARGASTKVTSFGFLNDLALTKQVGFKRG